MEGQCKRRCTGKWGTIPEKLGWPSRSSLTKPDRQICRWCAITSLSLDVIQPCEPQLDFKACYAGRTGKAICVDEASCSPDISGQISRLRHAQKSPRAVPEDTAVVFHPIPEHRRPESKNRAWFPRVSCFYQPLWSLAVVEGKRRDCMQRAQRMKQSC